MNDKVHEFVLVHLFRMEVSDQETDVIALNRLSSEDEEVLSPHHHEPHELLAKDLLNLIRLLNGNGYTNGVYRGLDLDFFLLVSADDERGQQKLLTTPPFDFGLVVSLDNLALEVLDTKRGVEGGPNGLQIWLECGRLNGRKIVVILIIREYYLNISISQTAQNSFTTNVYKYSPFSGPCSQLRMRQTPLELKRTVTSVGEQSDGSF